jgi:predicted AlkP superfamily pyrophosphatase or phosphodiesterase
MNQGTNIFDYLTSKGIAHHVSAPELTEEANLTAVTDAIQQESIDFAFVYWPGLDALLHAEGNTSPSVATKLSAYERWIEGLVSVAKQHYAEVRLYVFSDHGMANCSELLDLKAIIEGLPLRMPKDYAMVLDSTMARFWFFNEKARKEIEACLSRVPQGRIVPDSELEEMGTLFPDRYFGELIFLVREGVLIVPSHMGERPIRAMHGYHPAEPQSYAALCTNQMIPERVDSIPNLYRLMVSDADLAKARNSGAPQKVTGSSAS